MLIVGTCKKIIFNEKLRSIVSIARSIFIVVLSMKFVSNNMHVLVCVLLELNN